MKSSRIAGSLLLALAALALSASPALANHIDSANGTVTCSSFTLNVTGSELFDEVVDSWKTFDYFLGDAYTLSGTAVLNEQSDSPRYRDNCLFAAETQLR